LSALYDVPHGAGLAVLTPAWMNYVCRDNPNMFVQFAVNVMGATGSYREPDALIAEGVSRLSKFFKELGLPSTLAELGIGSDRLEEMAKRATGEGSPFPHTLGGLKKLDWRDVLAIFRVAA
jgi:alcohol dehydrogenase YqhD (iron-dependent ADH family)